MEKVSFRFPKINKHKLFPRQLKFLVKDIDQRFVWNYSSHYILVLFFRKVFFPRIFPFFFPPLSFSSSLFSISSNFSYHLLIFLPWKDFAWIWFNVGGPTSLSLFSKALHFRFLLPSRFFLSPLIDYLSLHSISISFLRN